MRVINSRSEPIDYCRTCAPSEEEAREEHGDVGNREDDGLNCFEHDADHPPYDWDPNDPYRCDTCGRKLTDKD